MQNSHVGQLEGKWSGNFYRTLFCQKRKSSRDVESERIRILLERRKEQTLAEVRTKIQKREFQAESERRSIQESTGIIDSSEEKLIILLQMMNSIFVKLVLTRVQESRTDEFSRRRFIEKQDTVTELTVQELQNEINCVIRDLLRMLCTQ